MTIRFLISVVIALALAGPDAAGQIPCSYEIAAIIEGPDCGILGQASAVGTGISPNGEYVCGYFTCPGGNDVAFLYTVKTGAVMTIPFQSGFSSMIALDVNDSAILVGGGEKFGIGQRGFVYYSVSDQFVELPAQSSSEGWSFATGINSWGTVCGQRSLDDGGSPINPYNAFVWSPNDGFSDLGVMNGPNSWATSIADNGTVVGITGSVVGLNRRAFIHAREVTTILEPLPGALTSGASAVGNAGHVLLGGTVQQSPVVLGVAYVLYEGQLAQQIPLPGYPTLQTRGMNNSANVVGNSGNDDVGVVPTMWSNGVPFDLFEMCGSPPAINMKYGRGISDNTRIIVESTMSGVVVTIVLFPIDRKPGDSNCDNVVNVDDLLTIINAWGPCPGCSADLNADGIVSHPDLMEVILHWSSS